MTHIRRIAVLGAGTMGHGIAHAAMTGGFETFMYDVSDEAVARGSATIEQIVRKGVELGKVGATDADAIFDDMYVTYWGSNVLYRNNGKGGFEDVTKRAGVAGSGKEWSSGRLARQTRMPSSRA